MIKTWQRLPPSFYWHVVAGVTLFGALIVADTYHFLLFHSLAEVFSIAVAISVFMLMWNTRKYHTNGYLLVMGVAYLSVGCIDLIHMLAYKGMGIFIGYDANLPTQLWIAARYIQAGSLLVAPVFLQRQIRARVVMVVYVTLLVGVFASIFYWDVFPTSYIEGQGLTPFKIISEYIISLMLLGSIAMLWAAREHLSRSVLFYLIASTVAAIVSELAFTFYVGVYDLSNLVGHMLKIVSFYLMYKALVETGLRRPYAVIFKDLQATQEDLEEANGQLKQANLGLSQLSKMKDTFVDGISHELRTPLTSIKLHMHLLSHDVDDLPAKRMRIIKSELDRLNYIIDELLVISTLEHGSLTVQPELVNLGDMAADYVACQGEVAQSHKLSLQFTAESPVPDTCMDPQLIERVLSILLSNAYNYTPQGGAIDVSIALIADNGHQSIQMRVSDTGHGIPLNEQPRIFESFYRGSLVNNTLVNVPGTGVGLTIAKEIIEAHGGSIAIESPIAFGKGTRVVCVLPVVAAHP